MMVQAGLCQTWLEPKLLVLRHRVISYLMFSSGQVWTIGGPNHTGKAHLEADYSFGDQSECFL